MTDKGFTKKFHSQIENLKNSYLLSFAIVDLISHDDVLSILEKDSFNTGTYKFEFKDICTLIRNSKSSNNNDFKILIWEYLMFSTRALFMSLYEGFKDDRIRYSLVKETDWFVFLANIRHSLAHGIDAIWKIKDFGKSEIFYLRTNDNIKIVIDKNWNNTPMKFDQIGGWVTPIDFIVFIETEVERLMNSRATSDNNQLSDIARGI